MNRTVLHNLLIAGAACYALVTPTFATTKSQIDFANADTPQEVKGVIQTVFGKKSIMVTIAWCESKFHQFNKDGSVLQGEIDPRDTGVFQFNTHWHEKTSAELGYDIRTLEGNVLYAEHVAVKKIVDGQKIVDTKLWNNSGDCWRKYL